MNIPASILSTALLLLSSASLAGEGVLGFWKTIDDETREAKSIVHVYQYQGKVYGRVVKILKNKGAKAKLPGAPSIEGMDIIWDLKKDGEKYSGGEVLDPEKGKVYDCQLWRERDNLILRGSLFGIGRRQTWLPANDYKPTNPANPVPSKPKLK